MRFLLVEDNENLAEAVSTRLGMDGHAIDTAGSLADAWEYLDYSSYDIVLLDLTLPDGDGRRFLAQCRAQGNDVPVIAVTAQSDVSSRVEVLDAGADDYISKPVNFSELEARCRAVLRRRGGSSHNVQRFADLEFDTLRAELRFGSKARELRNREMRLLEIFFSGPDRIFSKVQIGDRLFTSSEEISDNVIEVYVARLRKKIEGSGAQIETVRGLGYRLSERG